MITRRGLLKSSLLSCGAAVTHTGGQGLMRGAFSLLLAMSLLKATHLEAQLDPATAKSIDSLVGKVLADTATPSESIAVVKEGMIAYVKAYGSARLTPMTSARPEMRYSIGSISKQFMAGAILLLEQEGKLSLDDPVSKYLQSLTRGQDIPSASSFRTRRDIKDYYPLDYVAPFMQQPVTSEGILDRWAKKPLDFEPGTEWQYSNTNYVVAGCILEKVTGMPAFSFLQSRILEPLGMKSAIDLDRQPLADSDAAGYTRFGLAPVHPLHRRHLAGCLRRANLP